MAISPPSHTYEHLAQWYLIVGPGGRDARARDFRREVLESDLPPVAAARVLYDLAIFYTIIGRTDEALANLTEAVRLHPAIIAWAKEDSAFEALRDEPEYQALYTE